MIYRLQLSQISFSESQLTVRDMMNINDFESIIKVKFLEKNESPAEIEIDDFSEWKEEHKNKLKALISQSPSRLILISCGSHYNNETREFKKIAKEAYLNKYMQGYKPNQKKINSAKFSKTPPHVKIVIQSVEQKSTLLSQQSPVKKTREKLSPKSPLSSVIKPLKTLDRFILDNPQQEEPDHQKAQQEKKLLKKFSEPMQKEVGVLLQWIGAVFNVEFESRLATILSSILNVKKKDLCFSLSFLTTETTKQQFAQTPQTIKSLEKLANMSPAAQKWWEQLVQCHIKKNASNFDFNFVDCFELFYTFNEDLKQLNLALPEKVTVDPEISENFDVLLNRISKLVLNAPNPTDQLTHLEGIPFGQDLTVHVKQVYKELFDTSEPSIQDNFLLMSEFWKEDTRIEDIRNGMDKIRKMNFSPEVRIEIIRLFAKVCAEEKQNFHIKNINVFLEAVNSHLLEITSGDAEPQRSRLLKAFYKDTKLGDMEQVALLMKQAHEMDEASLQALNHCLTNSGLLFADRLLTKVKKSNPIAQINSDSFKVVFQNFITTMVGTAEYGIDLNQYMRIMTAIQAINPPENINHDELNEWITQLKAHPEILGALSQINLSKSAALPTLPELFDVTKSLVESLRQKEFASENLMEGIILKLGATFNNTVYGEATISNVSDLVIEGFKDTISKFSFIFEEYDLNPPAKNYADYFINYTKKDTGTVKIENGKEIKESVYVRDVDGKEKFAIPLFETLAEIPSLLGSLKPSLNESISKLFREIGHLVVELEKKDPTFDLICKHLGQITSIAENELFGKILMMGYKGEDFLPILLTGKPGMRNGVENRITIPFLGDITDSVKKATFDSLFLQLGTINRPGLNRDKILEWLKNFCDSRSILFFFKEMLVEQKVIPGVSRMLDKLDLSSSPAYPLFKKNIDRLMGSLETQPEGMHLGDAELLKIYEQNISGISRYLNSVKQMKEQHPTAFLDIFSKVESDLTELDFSQKANFIRLLLNRSINEASDYIDIVKRCFSTSTQTFDQAAKERALAGIDALMMGTEQFDAEFCKNFLQMSFEHYLTSDQPFFLDTLQQIKNLDLSPKEEPIFRNNLIRLLQNDPSLKTGIGSLLAFLSQEDASQCKINKKYCEFFVNMISKVKSPDDLTRVLSIKDKLVEGKINQTFENVSAIILKLQKEKSTNPEKQKEWDQKEFEYLEKIFHLLSGKFSIETREEYQYLLNLFKVYPQPKVKQFLDVLNDSKINLKKWCEQFGKNPYAQDYTQSRFEQSDVRQSIIKLKNMMAENMAIPQKTQNRLATQMNYIASMETTLADLTREDLQKNVSALLKEIREMGDLTSKKKSSYIDSVSLEKIKKQKEYERKTLELIAHMREAYKRTVGMMPHSTQILTLLLTMTSKDADQAASNLLMQIKTGEGKSLITPLVALCQWAKGGSVDICTSNRTLAEEGFRKYGKPFFDFFVDENNEPMIHTNWLKDEKQKLPQDNDPRSIRFAAMEDLALIRLDQPPAPNTHLIYDEVDTVLDKPILYNLAYQETDEKANNFTEFLCESVDKFVEKNEFKDVTSPQAWSEDEDAFQFKLYLRQTDAYHDIADCRKRVDGLSDFEAREWIDAMLTAKKLKQGTDFVIVKGTCVPLQNGVPQTGTYGNNVQQSLHFLNSAKKGSPAGCKVSAPTKIIKSMSATQMIKHYTGRLIGISGTLGEPDDLEAAHHLFGTQAVEIPPHRHNKRLCNPPTFTRSSEESVKKVREVIQRKFNLDAQKTAKKRKVKVKEHDVDLPVDEHLKLLEQAKMEMEQVSAQPILIIVDDYKKADALAAQLADFKEKGFIINCVEGTETLEELQSKIISPAGNTRHITIATPHMGRGIDFSSLFNKGICLISLATHPRTARLEAQIEGRTARNGKDGEYVPIYQITPPKSAWGKVCFYLRWFVSFFTADAWQKDHWKALVKDVNEHYHEDRIYVNAIDDIQTSALKHIGEWETLLRDIHPNDAQLEDLFKTWRSEFFTKLGTFEEAEIKVGTSDKAIERFKMQIENYFKDFRTRYVDKTSTPLPHSTHWVDREYLLNLDLSDLLLEVRSMRAPNSTLGLQSIEMPNEGIIDFDLAMKDTGYARWYYSGDKDGFTEHEMNVLEHINQKLDRIDYPGLKKVDSEKKSLSEATAERLNHFLLYLEELPAKGKLLESPILWEFHNLCEIGKKMKPDHYAFYTEDKHLRKQTTNRYGLPACVSYLALELIEACRWSEEKNGLPSAQLVQIISRTRMLEASRAISAAAQAVRLENSSVTRKNLYATLWTLEQQIKDDVYVPIPFNNAIPPVTLLKDTLNTLKSIFDLSSDRDKDDFYQAQQEHESGVGWVELLRSRQMEHLPDGRIKVQAKAEEVKQFKEEPNPDGFFSGYRSSEKIKTFLENEEHFLKQKLEPLEKMDTLIAIQQFVHSDKVSPQFLETLKEHKTSLTSERDACEFEGTKIQFNQFLDHIKGFFDENEKLSAEIEPLMNPLKQKLKSCQNNIVEIEEKLDEQTSFTQIHWFTWGYHQLKKDLEAQGKLESTLRGEITTIDDDYSTKKNDLRQALNKKLSTTTYHWTSTHDKALEERGALKSALNQLNKHQQQESDRSRFMTRTFENQKKISTFFAAQTQESQSGDSVSRLGLR